MSRRPRFATANNSTSTGTTGGPVTSTSNRTHPRPDPHSGEKSLLNNNAVSGIASNIGSMIDMTMINNLTGMLGQNVGSLVSSIAQHPFLQDDGNRGWILVGGAAFGVMFLISMLWQFIFSFMLSYASVKVMLWFFEHYQPDENSDEIIGDHYVSESSPIDVIEYLVVIVVLGSATFLAYLPIPFAGFLVYFGCVVTSVMTMANKGHRQWLCLTVRDLLVAPDYVPNAGMEGRIHSSLQTFCYTIESLNIGTFNIAYDGRAVYSDLKTSESFGAGLRRLTRRVTSHVKKLRHEKPGKGDDSDDESASDSEGEGTDFVQDQVL